MSLFEDEERQDSIGTITGVAGVALVLTALLLAVLMFLGRVNSSPGSMTLVAGTGIAGAFLLVKFLRMNWRRDLRARNLEGNGPFQVVLQVGPEGFPSLVGRSGTATVEGGEVVLVYRTLHMWLLVGGYLLFYLNALARREPPILTVVAWIAAAFLFSIRSRRRIPLADVRLAVVDGPRLHLYHGAIGESSVTTLQMGGRELRLLRERLAPLLPLEVLPPPARAPRARTARVPPPPAPPRTALDGRKVKELDRAMEDLERLERGPGAS